MDLREDDHLAGILSLDDRFDGLGCRLQPADGRHRAPGRQRPGDPPCHDGGLVVDGETRCAGVLGIRKIDVAQVDRAHRAVGNAGKEYQHAIRFHDRIAFLHQRSDRHFDDHIVRTLVTRRFHDEVIKRLF